MSLPPSSSRPARSGKSPISTFITVVLPMPFNPISATTWFSFALSERWPMTSLSP